VTRNLSGGRLSRAHRFRGLLQGRESASLKLAVVGCLAKVKVVLVVADRSMDKPTRDYSDGGAHLSSDF
jgi:hypothetical protein